MSVASMTGFGKAQVSRNTLQLEIEIRSVNHRFLDVNTRMPSMYSCFEHAVAKKIKEKLQRGRVDVFVSRTETGEPEYELQFNAEIFNKYLDVVRKAFTEAGLSEKKSLSEVATVRDTVLQLLQKREVVELKPKDVEVEEEFSQLEEALNLALDKLIEMRKVEGKALEKELNSQLGALEGVVSSITEKSGSTVATFRERLSARLKKLESDVQVDEERLAQEVAILAERVDISEELARMQSHCEQFRQVLASGSGGRKLDFLIQEMVREINTTGSKAQNSEVTNLVVEAKAITEKLREQVQNIE